MANKLRAEDASFQSLWNLKRLSIPGLSVHLLRVRVQDQTSYNTYLNIARLFAWTPTVMLLPGNLTDIPLISHESLVSQRLSSRYLPSIPARKAQSWSNFSTLPLTPFAIVPRDSSVWCTERFTLNHTPMMDWKLCLWQLWLHSFGEFMSVTPIITPPNQLSTNVSTPLP